MVIRSVIFVLGIVPFCIKKWEKIQGIFKCDYISLNKGKVVCSGTFEVIPFNERIINLLGLYCISSKNHSMRCWKLNY